MTFDKVDKLLMLFAYIYFFGFWGTKKLTNVIFIINLFVIGIEFKKKKKNWENAVTIGNGDNPTR